MAQEEVVVLVDLVPEIQHHFKHQLQLQLLNHRQKHLKVRVLDPLINQISTYQDLQRTISLSIHGITMDTIQG